MRKPILGLITGLVVIGLIATISWASAETSGKQGHPLSVKAERVSATPLDADPVVGLSSVEAQIAQVGSYVDALKKAEDQQHLVEYLAAVAAADEQARQQALADQAAQEARSNEIQRAPAPIDTPHTSGGGSCYGGPIPDYIVTRESGGNPMAENPSGAFGCYQIMPEWWSGACSGFDKYTIDGQKACAAILWNGGAGASNWALTN